MSTLEHEILREAHEARSMPAFRARVLAMLAETIRFDVALFHALSPRVPLETGALHGVEMSRLSASMRDWDRLAVELGAIREHANTHGGVAADHEVFAAEGKARDRLRGALRRVFRLETMAVVHLTLRGAVRAAIVIGRRARDPFDAPALALLRTLVPALSVADALHESLDGAVRASLPVTMRCEDDRLTPRQREIVTLVAHGHTNAAIARALSVSPNTLRNALADVFVRLGASNRADVVRLAVLRPA